MGIHLLAVAALAVVALDAGSVAALAALDAVAASRPCDIYGRAGTPCVAAHSTVRALYASYRGPLYELMRADGATANVSVTAAGYADAAAQDAFCAGARTCVVRRIYDQSPMANHLAPAPASAASYGRDHPCPRQLPATPVDARKHPIVMGGAHRAYGAWFEAVWNSNLQLDFNARICDSFDASSSAVLRELDESNRFVQTSAASTSMSSS